MFRGGLSGLDLFSGIGGITLALSPWVRPVAYCEKDRHAQAVLLSRMSQGDLPVAPIWDDVQTLTGSMLPPIDIIYGGFPCQDLSVAGNQVGLEGKRSGLFFEIVRLADEIKPSFLFLENVPPIRTLGLHRVGEELARLGYDCRWGTVSAEEVGAPHLRRRWFLFAYADRQDLRNESRRSGGEIGQSPNEFGDDGSKESMADSARMLGQEIERDESQRILREVCDSSRKRRRKGRARAEVRRRSPDSLRSSACFRSDWWLSEPEVGRVAHGVSHRVDRLRGLGNAVVPRQAREAFEKLSGLVR
jgi:DNA (cytosine-5)-methyltransferase 1